MASAIAVKLEDVAWRQAHEELVRLATERAGLDFEEGRWLLRAHRSGAHLRLGYASFQEYTERLFGYGPRLTQEKLRVAEALEELPETAGNLQSGAISFSLARELTRVAIPSTEQQWLEAARGRTVREVEHLVSGHRPGSLPDDVPDPGIKRHVLRLDLSGEVLASFREAMAKIRRDAGEALDDDAAILLLCRQALEGPKDPGRSSYQIALTVCESCRRATQQGRGELIEVGPEIVEMAECDGQHIGHVNADAGAGAREQVGGRAHVGANDDVNARAHVGAHHDARAHVGAGEPDRAHGHANPRAHVGAGEPADARGHANPRAHVGASEPAGMLGHANPRAHVGASEPAGMLGHANPRAHVGARHPFGELDDASAHVGRARVRAAQTIPPKIRRAVFHRDGGKCRVPGCRHAVFTDVHHIVLRSEHGTHSPENLVTLCAAHHHRIHEGKLTVTGSASSQLDFTHADGAPYGGAVAPAVADARAKAFRALTGMGFGDGETKRALARVPPAVSSLEQLIRQALRGLASQ